jgi:hypothetical protein
MLVTLSGIIILPYAKLPATIESLFQTVEVVIILPSPNVNK